MDALLEREDHVNQETTEVGELEHTVFALFFIFAFSLVIIIICTL